jgi:hypothetical protein
MRHTDTETQSRAPRVEGNGSKMERGGSTSRAIIHRRSSILVLLPSLCSLCFCVAFSSSAAPATQPSAYFGIHVVDDQTGRGVPLVELQTVDRQRFYTDSAGYVAFLEPGLMDRRVFFYVSSFGYEFPADGFGFRGTALQTTPGKVETLRIKRTNIAERLYRVTGRGIYADSVQLGQTPPIAEPLLNAQVLGQDSNIAEIYRGRIYWFWGDTSRAAYPLGQFATSGATSSLPGNEDGLPPSMGVNLHYFTDAEGFSKKMAPVAGTGPVWIDGVCVAKDDAGHERMLAHYSRMKDLGTRLERGLMVYNDATEHFDKLKQIELDALLAPAGHSMRVTVDGADYVYFSQPYPCIRVRASWSDLTDLTKYEGYTCLADRSRYRGRDSKIDRDVDGRPIFRWRRDTEPLKPEQQDELIKAGLLKRDDLPCRPIDVDTNKPVQLHGGSFYFNAFGKKWISIFVEAGGASYLGEVWYAEADKPEGLWTRARKIATHVKPAVADANQIEKQTFYNPTQHPFFDEDGGRIIYFEGTYSFTFSGNPTPTPKYEYNQVMYRLDLADPRLRLKE